MKVLLNYKRMPTKTLFAKIFGLNRATHRENHSHGSHACGREPLLSSVRESNHGWTATNNSDNWSFLVPAVVYFSLKQ